MWYTICMRKIFITLLMSLFFVFGSHLAAQDRGYHRGHRPVVIYRQPERIHWPSRPIQRRAVKVVVYIDQFGRVLYTDTNFADNLYVSERYIVEADRRARARYFRPTGFNRRKTVYIYFRY